ncbi:MAG: transglycosylase family protein [Acidobacteria bacterium]|nr:transglycosylase family protein [Acidobacteriota bacterium]
MEPTTTTTTRRGRAIALGVLWMVVVPVALGIGIAEGRIRLQDKPARLISAPATTVVPTTTTTTAAVFAIGERPTSTTAAAGPAALDGTLAREVVWYQLADCESGAWTGGTPIAGSARWEIVARGYQGGLQFHPVTWDRFRSPSDPAEANLATSAQQIAVGERVLAREGVMAWPTCGPRVGLARLLAPGHVPVTDALLLPAAEPTILDDE